MGSKALSKLRFRATWARALAAAGAHGWTKLVYVHPVSCSQRTHSLNRSYKVFTILIAAGCTRELVVLGPCYFDRSKSEMPNLGDVGFRKCQAKLEKVPAFPSSSVGMPGSSKLAG